MATLTDPDQESFKFAMLLYDTRYRSMTIQVVAMIGFVSIVFWLISNTITNLNNLGKPVEFDFLFAPSSYDINQRLVDYDSRDSHLKASFVGVLNTLVVAFLGCITATIIGVFVGVARLSKNWLISRIMGVYVEAFRNVPVLLWIVLAMAILIEGLPVPKAFRGGEDAEASMKIFESVAFSNQGIFIPRIVPADAGFILLIVALISFIAIIALRKRADRIQEKTGIRQRILGLSFALAFLPFALAFTVITLISQSNDQSYLALTDKQPANVEALISSSKKLNYCHAAGDAASLNGLRYLKQNEMFIEKQKEKAISLKRKNYFSESSAKEAFQAGKCNLITISTKGAVFAAEQIEIKETKKKLAVVVLDADFVEGKALELEIAEITPKGIPKFEGGTHLRNSLIALWLALSLYTAAFIAEIVRGGILAISRGQTEAAASLGLRPNRIMNLVVLPQALRVIIPPLISNYLNLTKNSSLAIAVGYMDVTGTLGGITLNQTGRELECILLMMLVYLSISLLISAVMNWYNNSVKLVER